MLWRCRRLHDLDEVGITGYPESHPKISDEMTIQAMYEKVPYATYIISQICFDPEVTSTGLGRGVGAGCETADPRYARLREPPEARGSSAASASATRRFIEDSVTGSQDVVARCCSPDRLIEGLKPSFADPESNIQGLHIYTFNEFERTETWRREMLERAETSA